LDQVVRGEDDLLIAVNLEDYKWEENEKSNHSTTRFKRLQAGINALSNNYISLTYDTLSILMKRNTELALRLTPPDLYLNVELGEYGSYDYDEAEAISHLGKEQMSALLRKQLS